MNFKGRRKPGRFLFFGLIGIAALFGFSAIVMLLWNAILPSLLHVGVLGYWQAMGLLVLSKILFGSMGPGGPRRGRHWGGPPYHLREKFMNMSEEEKTAFKEHWQKQWWGKAPE
ncbi:MAG: hypothetical protein HYR66_13875 [Sphingobacteriales bacterium]|nr:hypothetical protein [Sphingobacteriales bacterium]MBI3718663.1 hypothetical protein [Sphingobacteriales bacterium]